MATKDKRIDAYIEKAQPFAKPILKQLRKLIHTACPNVEEGIKWGMPSFDYKGPLCHMAAFKQHAVFGFWKWKLINDPKKYLSEIKSQGGNAMGNLGKITNVKELPPDSAILNFIKQAAKLNDDGVKPPIKKSAAKPDILMPVYFKNVLAKNKKAKSVFEAFSPSHKREYLEWITEAKTEETRNKRMVTAIEWLTEGKIRNWKYVKSNK